MTRDQISVLHVITGLEVGGAELMLLRLLAASISSHFPISHEVVSLTTIGPTGSRLQAAGVGVVSLGMRNGVPDPRGLVALVRLLRRRSPSLIQTWMYHADLLGGIAARLAGDIPVIWSIRQSDVKAENRLHRLLAQVINPLLSRWMPKAIVCCGERVRDVHVGYGYAREKCVVIPNGFDLERFKANSGAGALLRAELKIPEDAPVVGMAARLHPMKDHATFLAAAAIVARSIPAAVFVLCGDGLTAGSPTVARLVLESGLPMERLRLIGRRDDLENIYPALTVAVLSSKSGEGFPNVLGEAMACGVPCVATDVGDSALIVGEHGRIVPPGDAGALAGAVLKLLHMPEAERTALGLAARAKIAERYSIAAVAGQYESLYEQVAARRERGGGR